MGFLKQIGKRLPGSILMCMIPMLALLTAAFPMLSDAHQNSESNLNLQLDERQIKGQWRVNLLDLQLAYGVDQNVDGNISWEEILLVEKDLTHWLFSHLAFYQRANQSGKFKACPITSTSLLVDNRSTGTYLVFPFTGQCQEYINSTRHQTHLDYNLLFDLDQRHRAVLSYQWLDAAGKERSVTEILRIDQPQTVLANPSSVGTETVRVLYEFFKEGIWHIWIGLDHILFLVALIIPSVRSANSHPERPVMALRGRRQTRVGIDGASLTVVSFRQVMADITLIVTCFTLAHSVTLAGAALQWLILPSWLVETAIALSVIIAGLNMLYPVFDRQRWLIAIIFGLIHGLGFASVLSDLTLSPGHFYAGLFGFNMGVEFGQMVIVAGLLPILYLLRTRHFYLHRFIPGTGVSIAGIGCLWLFGRGLIA